MENITFMLRTHNLKATPQRIAILEAVYKYGHINIEKLYEDIKNKFDSISLATIYKNINAMTKNSLLFEVKLPNEKSVFEVIKHKHSHLLCNECKDVVDINLDTTQMEKNVSSKHNFKIVQSDFVFSGTCQSCIDKTSTTKGI